MDAAKGQTAQMIDMHNDVHRMLRRAALLELSLVDEVVNGGMEEIAEEADSTTVFTGFPRQWRTGLRPFVMHMRKAGGTTLRKALLRHFQAKNVELHASEGYSLPPMWLARADTWLATVIRDPIERIKSSWNYEGRWREDDGISIEERNSSLGIPFYAYVRQVLSKTANVRVLVKDGQLEYHEWMCVDNCQVRQLVAVLLGGFPAAVGEAEYLIAREMLRRFDLVLVTETMSSNDAQQLIRAAVGDSEFTAPKEAAWGDHGRVDTPDNYPADAMTVLEAHNVWDKRLPEFATKLYEERVRIMKQR